MVVGVVGGFGRVGGGEGTCDELMCRHMKMPAARPCKPVSSTSVSTSFTPHFPSHTFSDNKGEARWGPLTKPPPPTHPPSPRQRQQGLINVSRREGSVRHLTVIRTRPRRTRVDRRRRHSSPSVTPPPQPPHHHCSTPSHAAEPKHATHMSLDGGTPETPIMEGEGGRVSGGQCGWRRRGQGLTVLASHMSVRVKAERVQLKDHHAVRGSSAGN